MDQNVLSYVEEKTMALIDAPTCSQETKAAAQSWLAAQMHRQLKPGGISKSWKRTSCPSIR